MIVGAGEMAELAARHLSDQVDKSLIVFNRTYENACSLARQLRGRAAPMERLNEGLIEADVVITSTGSCEPLINENQIRTVMRRRRFRPIFMIDIAIPRDIVQENLGERRQEAEKGEAIVEDEVEKFMKWTKTLHSTPTIIALKEKLETIRTGELARLNGKLSDLSQEEREIVELITRSIVNKIAHDPISFLRKTGLTTKQNMYLDVVQRLFKLDSSVETGESKEEESFKT
jgi:glutamyl-tRNA reductase